MDDAGLDDRRRKQAFDRFGERLESDRATMICGTSRTVSTLPSLISPSAGRPDACKPTSPSASPLSCSSAPSCTVCAPKRPISNQSYRSQQKSPTSNPRSSLTTTTAHSNSGHPSLPQKAAYHILGLKEEHTALMQEHIVAVDFRRHVLYFLRETSPHSGTYAA